MTKEPTQDELDELYRSIEESNTVFLAMTREEKRVQLAKDGLKQLEMGRIKPASTYFDPVNREMFNLPGDVDMRESLKKVPQCYVCGIGALFLVALDRFDRLSVAQFSYAPSRMSRRYLVDELNLFDDNELFIVEDYFENVGRNDEIRKLRMTHLLNYIILIKGAPIDRQLAYSAPTEPEMLYDQPTY